MRNALRERLTPSRAEELGTTHPARREVVRLRMMIAILRIVDAVLVLIESIKIGKKG